MKDFTKNMQKMNKILENLAILEYNHSHEKREE